MLLDNMKKALNQTVTLNGSPALKSSESAVLDLFARGGAMMGKRDQLRKLIDLAFMEDANLATRAVLYLSDVRQGQGVRDVLRATIELLIERYDEFVINEFIRLIPEYSRWDALYQFVGTDYEPNAFRALFAAATIAKQKNDYLVFKWLKSADASSKETRKLGRLTAFYFGMSEREYRKFLSAGRAKLNLVENALTHKNLESFNYETTPSKASLKYRKAFLRNDYEHYSQYLSQVEKGEKKMNMGVAYPHEIVSQYLDKREQINQTLELAWKNLPNYALQEENMLVVCDTSGSMGARVNQQSTISAMSISVSLAIYTAQRNKGFFHNHFISFSESPALIQIRENESLKDTVTRVLHTDWGYSTDIDKVMRLILNSAKMNNLPQEELPSTVLIISDMQFNSCIENTRNLVYWKKLFKESGYELPAIVFWNVMDYGNLPASQNELGVGLVSGYSPVTLKFIYEGIMLTPYDLMLRALKTERYDVADRIFKGLN